MATLIELVSLHGDEGFGVRQRVTMACVIAAEAIRTESGATPNHANRIKWAKQVFENPVLAGDSMTWAVLAQNAGAALATIIAATDNQVQTAVNNAVDVFAQ